MSTLSPQEAAKQRHYRDARFKKMYDDIWQSVGKCVFCELNEKYVFFEENGVVMTISLYAYIDGHFMIVPKRHITGINELTQSEWETVRKFAYIARKLFKQVHGVKGMQLVQKSGSAAQSTVEHIHFHCIPFDSPDLNVWNYRQLSNTPLENVTTYKKARKRIVEYDLKFDKKYKHPGGLPVVCDLIAINEKDEVLLQERTVKLSPDTIGFPGGVVDDFSGDLEAELLREVLEETGVKLKKSDVKLFSSRIGRMSYQRYDKHLNVRYPAPAQFIWNTYATRAITSRTKLKAGDDSAGFAWVKLSKVAMHKRISEGIKEVIKDFNASR